MATEEVVIPVVAEELVVLTMEQDTGGVRATKVVHEREQLVDELLAREDVTIERKPVNQVLVAPVEVRQEGDTLIIPVMEEVVVVQRQLVLKEEIHIRKQQRYVHETERFIVRSEEVVVEQLPPKSSVPSEHKSKQPPPAPPGRAKGESR